MAIIQTAVQRAQAQGDPTNGAGAGIVGIMHGFGSRVFDFGRSHHPLQRSGQIPTLPWPVLPNPPLPGGHNGPPIGGRNGGYMTPDSAGQNPVNYAPGAATSHPNVRVT